MNLEYDEIGFWSEIKLDIIRKYAAAYSTIMANQRFLKHIYVDAFAGPGVHIARTTGDFVLGSPLNALQIQPPFKEYHLIDADGGRIDQLKQFIGERKEVFLYQGDCNEILPNKIYPRARYLDYGRALCLLDPYGIDLSWEVVKAAGQMRTIEIFLNFMIMDANRNVLRHDPEGAEPKQVARMNRFWGDDSWRTAAYDTSGNLFGWPEKSSNEQLVQAYRERLLKVAGFGYVPDPLPMRNSVGATVYYLFFASPNATGQRIVEDIFAKYRNRGAS